MADTNWDAVINGLRDQITQMQQVITAQQTQITQGEQGPGAVRHNPMHQEKLVMPYITIYYHG